MAATVIPFPSSARVMPSASIVSVSHEARDNLATRLLRRWLTRRRLAEDLPGMTDEVLADIGLTRAQARAEASRPFWRAGLIDGA